MHIPPRCATTSQGQCARHPVSKKTGFSRWWGVRVLGPVALPPPPHPNGWYLRGPPLGWITVLGRRSGVTFSTWPSSGSVCAVSTTPPPRRGSGAVGGEPLACARDSDGAVCAFLGSIRNRAFHGAEGTPPRGVQTNKLGASRPPFQPRGFVRLRLG